MAPVDLGLKGRHALVTGASRGLGRAVASGLAAEGADVVAVARNLERLEALASECAGPGTITAHACDLRDPRAISELGGALGRSDILVLNTGGPPPGSAADTSDSAWTQHFEAMFLSAIRLSRLSLAGMRERGFGRIIVIVSSGVIQPIPNLAISNALRMALVGWAKTLAAEVAGQGITVNCLAPGRISTDRVAELDHARARREGISPEEAQKQSLATIPAGRYGEVGEFASMATFLAGTRSAYMTGSVIRIDGGMIRSV
ncbi:MAG TPA: SDR family oxidoreductase [Steroidobacteraceae bacterium]|nr:SDR family oxidoreductase [Steroidobacteraceae bacterium]